MQGRGHRVQTVLLHGGSVWDGSGEPAFAADVLSTATVSPESGRARPRSCGLHATSTSRGIPSSPVSWMVTPICHSCTRPTSPRPATCRPRSIRCARCSMRARCSKRTSRRASAEAPRKRGSRRCHPQCDRGGRHCRGRACSQRARSSPTPGNLGDERRMHIYRESIAMVVDGAGRIWRGRAGCCCAKASTP